MTERQRHIHTAPYSDSAETRARNWIEANLAEFVPAIHGFINAARAKVRKFETGKKLAAYERAYDLELRLPEEMPICTMWLSWSRNNAIPAGFQIVSGAVNLEDCELRTSPRRGSAFKHWFLQAMDDSDVILDHCAGQFYKSGAKDIPKGDRLATIASRAGDLTTKFTNSEGDSHTFLFGKKSEIAGKTGLIYKG